MANSLSPRQLNVKYCLRMKVIVMAYPEIIEDPTDSPFKVNRYVGVRNVFFMGTKYYIIERIKIARYFDIKLAQLIR